MAKNFPTSVRNTVRYESERCPAEIGTLSDSAAGIRINTDYKQGMNFTALPTAFVTGFDKNAQLRIGSTTAWAIDTLGATAGYLEFNGEGLSTFERAHLVQFSVISAVS